MDFDPATRSALIAFQKYSGRNTGELTLDELDDSDQRTTKSAGRRI